MIHSPHTPTPRYSDTPKPPPGADESAYRRIGVSVFSRFRFLAFRFPLFPLLCFCSAVLAAPGTTTVASKTSTPPSAAATLSKGSKADPLEPQPLQSIFVIPSDPKEGKDPFFPKSTHVFASAMAARPPS